ncbi:MAG TPA: leucyl/phenylalanyl-tRNA--protein transferase [Terriglobales bacterium]|nr:leucyl/phenylalanyl-tRNA--protein transferase [Terriglobales bacterium]
MPVAQFPDPRSADEDGIVAIGGDLHPQSLLLAYRQGIFPWPVEGLPMLWFCPAERAVLDFAELHVPRSLARARRQAQLELSFDRAFAAVIRQCARTPRPGQEGTWITPEILRAYTRFHQLGHAHSVEAWSGSELVAGLYGVDVDGAFCAESMFYRRPNASKLALLHLVEHLARAGLDWIDVQVMTPHMQRLGARAISRDEFLERLAATRARGLRPFDPPL